MISVRNTDKIVKPLKEHKKPITTKELAKEIKINATKCNGNLKLIIRAIKNQSARWFSIKELTEICNINYKNIGRYLTTLENENKITIKREKTDKRKKLIRFKPKKVLYFFKLGNKYLHHPRSKLRRGDFALLNMFNAKRAEHIKLNEEVIRVIISVWENQTTTTPEGEVNFELGWGGNTSHKNKSMYHREYFNLFSKQALEKLKTKYTIHIYSLKEIKYLRNKKKLQCQAYKHIHYSKEIVSLLIEKKKREKMIPTPFVYHDYFILRVYGSLTITNDTFITNQNTEDETRTATKRSITMSMKEFEYYKHIYSFVSFHTTHYNPKYDREPNKELMREAEMIVLKKEMDKIDIYLEMPTLPNYEEFMDIIISRKKMIPKKILLQELNNP